MTSGGDQTRRHIIRHILSIVLNGIILCRTPYHHYNDNNIILHVVLTNESNELRYPAKALHVYYTQQLQTRVCS